jgi:hypothetical protein
VSGGEGIVRRGGLGFLSEVEAKYLFESYYTFTDILYDERLPAFGSRRTIFSSELHIFPSSPHSRRPAAARNVIT